MEPDLSMTRQAVAICTPEQFRAIKNQMGDERKLRCFTDFSLPEGYIYCIRSTPVHDEEIRSSVGNFVAIHMGIAPDGSIST